MQIFRQAVLETEEPEKVDGVDLTANGFFVKATDKGDVNPEWFLDKTLILGYDKTVLAGEGTVEHTFPISKSISKSIFRADLIIQTFRYNAGLHSPVRHADASITLNGKEIKLYTDSPMPNGVDWGYDRVLTFRVESFIKDETSLKVKLFVQEGVWWDIDEIRLEMITRKSKLQAWVTFLAGLIIGGVFDYIIKLLTSV